VRRQRALLEPVAWPGWTTPSCRTKTLIPSLGFHGFFVPEVVLDTAVVLRVRERRAEVVSEVVA
jgi:hypothetical protein